MTEMIIRFQLTGTGMIESQDLVVTEQQGQGMLDLVS